MNILLNGYKWKVKGFWPYAPFLGRSLEVGNELMGVTDWLDAEVPGGVHHDLLRAGLIEDPYFEQNSLKCEWVEHRWWMYRVEFPVDSSFKGKKLELQFKGIDYKAHFYLNREKLGEHEGMFEAVAFDVTQKLNYDSENELVVLFESAPQEMSQIGYTSMTKTQKSRFNYKWDFGTRLVNIGIWDDVVLKVTGEFTLDDVFISTDVQGEAGVINVSSSIVGKSGESCIVKVSINYDGECLDEWSDNIMFYGDKKSFNKKFTIHNPQIWYPNGAGSQPLYEAVIQVYHKGELSEEKRYFAGIRKLQYRQNEGSPREALPYTFVINGKPVYIRGVNLTPFDHLYGNVGKETYERYIQLIQKANINMVRVWGGGIIEKEYFYQLCDRYGIMVWQEFIQSSSGIDNIPSVDPHFMKLLKATAIQAVKQKRNHVCHTVWSGGNELTDENGIPVTYENKNIKMLKDIVKEYDPGKLFLPSSASGPNEFLNTDQPGRNHDVHGYWKYEGVEKHYLRYNKSDSLFHSEFGVEGCSSLDSLKRFLGEGNLKITNMRDNLTWRHHGELWDTLERDREIFGEFISLEQFIKASQFIQAEGLRYILESNRRREPKNSGSIIWQFNEPWPNVSCTSLVDYFGIPKMAYYWTAKAYSPIHASLSYERLFYKPSEPFIGGLYIHNNLEEQELKVILEILDVSGKIIEKEEICKPVSANTVQKLKDITTVIPALKQSIFFVRLRVYDRFEEERCENLYVFSQLCSTIFSPLLDLKGGMLQIDKTDQGYRIKNIGEEVCLFIYGREVVHSGQLLIEDNYSSLFPGEEKHFKVYELNLPQNTRNHEMQIIWDFFNKRNVI